ncbi:hydrogenase subunit MbhD domain-containing protein [Cyanobium sp. Morenito 9A2]|uniref:hydrogenase subunit MbhD domain-containing protein n=1 Tax=Cyanobium sp. Morenito 9A2 TaxID=2823718 RepID=UPI0020CBDFF0|nr:hydrogenase subunit MbhD domain-containing protein [Cyanobium sp. Morenito 9A2]MCP9848892.1 DUF4040 domain-containing protein [Cyanobium sp. Morenito 9A2]
MNGTTLLLPLAALLPLTALLTVSQRRPAQALVLRGMLGAVAALVYALMGAADVALTEALVGTLLATVLYAVALRSSMVLRLGLAPDHSLSEGDETVLRQWLAEAQLGLELVTLEPGSDPERLRLHGQLVGGRQLHLASSDLNHDLQTLAGAEAWRGLGGTIAPGEPQP